MSSTVRIRAASGRCDRISCSRGRCRTRRSPPDREALQAIGAALLTPIGLRSLDPADPDFRGRHRGGPADRDRAYHQGTVWPWLIGPYVDACRRAQLSTTPYESLFVGLRRHLAEYGLGSVSETADGSAPHAGTGCPFQAWSVAECPLVSAMTDPAERFG